MSLFYDWFFQRKDDDTVREELYKHLEIFENALTDKFFGGNYMHFLLLRSISLQAWYDVRTNPEPMLSVQGRTNPERILNES